ncbi:DUF1381 domain-containing protein [Staphylococcus aureus]|nr:DUF1381 domain-containing protein [Staphylococcus aureus]
MTQYLVTTFKDSTGQPHEHFTTARDNQTFTVVEAESKEEAKEKYETRNELKGMQLLKWVSCLKK